jgi:hypothetical protein
MSERCVYCGGYRDAQSIFNWSEVDMRCNCQPPYAPKWAEEERARVYISEDLAREIHDRLLRARSEEEVNRNRAREQRNVPAERYHQRQLLRTERSLRAFIEQMEGQKVKLAS